MRKHIAVGLIAGVVALASTVFVPSEAQARDNNKQQLNQMAMQMYMQNLANQQNQQGYQNQLAQQFYQNQNPYNNGYNQYLNTNNPYSNSQFMGNGAGGCGGMNGHHHHRHNWQNQNGNGLLNSARGLFNGNGINGLGYGNNGYNNGNYNNGRGFNNGYGVNTSTVGRLLGRVF